MELSEEILRQSKDILPLHRIDRKWTDQYGYALHIDQGAFVPLYYLKKAGFHGQVILLSPYFSHYDQMVELGALIDRAALRLHRRIGIIASGDLSHRLLKGSPNGYTPNGAVFDRIVMINPTFLVHSVLNADGEICRMVGGNWYDAWLAGTETVYEVQKAPMKQKADVVFACAGGYPKDINLYQGCKCYDPAEAAVKDDGIVIAIIEAPDIKEPAIYMDSFRFDTPADMEAALRAHFTIPFYVAFTLFSLDHRNKVILVTKPENKEDVIRTGQVPVATVQEAWDIAKAELEKRGNKDYTINVMPHCASVFPVLTGK